MVRMLMEKPNISCIEVPLPDNPLRMLNCYVLRDDGEFLIIDTGFHRPECLEALSHGLDELGVCLDRAKLFLTHLHGDHTGLAEYFAMRDVPIYMNRIDYDYLKMTLRGEHWSRMEGWFSKEGFPDEALKLQASGNQARLYAPHTIFPVYPVDDGSTLTIGQWKLECIHTPGHTPGHTCLYLPEQQILFSGDHILFDITPNISVWSGRKNSLADYINSLDRFQRIPVQHTFPGHRAPAGSPASRIRTLQEHHRTRLQEVINLLQQDPGQSAYELASRMTWSARGIPWEQFSPNQRWFAMGEVLAHLEYLRAADIIQTAETASVRRNYMVSTIKRPEKG